MKSIKKTIVTENLINKSRFINYLIPVDTIEQVNSKLDELKKEYPDANHHCFCYILGEHQEIQKYSDDGEPNKTAGLPMIEVLKKHDLTNVLNVSIRYFGGIKLGAGGLVRAYTKGCAASVLEAEFSELIEFTRMEIIVPFDLIGQVEKYVRDNYILDDTKYDIQVHYYLTIKTSELDNLSNSLNDRTNGKSTLNTIETLKKYI